MALIFELFIKIIPYIALFGIWGELERIRKTLQNKNKDKEQK